MCCCPLVWWWWWLMCDVLNIQLSVCPFSRCAFASLHWWMNAYIWITCVYAYELKASQTSEIDRYMKKHRDMNDVLRNKSEKNFGRFQVTVIAPNMKKCVFRSLLFSVGKSERKRQVRKARVSFLSFAKSGNCLASYHEK